MTREVERHRPAHYQQSRQQEPYDPREAAYNAGMSLAAPLEGELIFPGDAPIRKTRTQRERKEKRSVHIVNDEEFIVTEETTFTETDTYGNSY